MRTKYKWSMKGIKYGMPYLKLSVGNFWTGGLSIKVVNSFKCLIVWIVIALCVLKQLSKARGYETFGQTLICRDFTQIISTECRLKLKAGVRTYLVFILLLFRFRFYVIFSDTLYWLWRRCSWQPMLRIFSILVQSMLQLLILVYLV